MLGVKMNFVSFCLILACLVAPLLQVVATKNTERAIVRPFYNIAHMVNNRYQLDDWLNYGANAIECDVSFAKDGTPRYLYHGIPCDAFRLCSKWDYIQPYIEAVRARTEPDSPKYNPNFTLIMFDLKVGKLEKQMLTNAGRKFAELVLIPLFNKTAGGLKAVLSHHVTDDVDDDLIKGVIDRLNATNPRIMRKIGFDVKRLSAIDQETFHRIPTGHIWLSEGETNWFVPFLQWAIKETLAKLIEQRNGDALTNVSKVITL